MAPHTVKIRPVVIPPEAACIEGCAKNAWIATPPQLNKAFLRFSKNQGVPFSLMKSQALVNPDLIVEPTLDIPDFILSHHSCSNRVVPI